MGAKNQSQLAIPDPVHPMVNSRFPTPVSGNGIDIIDCQNGTIGYTLKMDRGKSPSILEHSSNETESGVHAHIEHRHSKGESCHYRQDRKNRSMALRFHQIKNRFDGERTWHSGQKKINPA